MKKGTFYGIGVGPGDPELMTLKAVRLIKEADLPALEWDGEYTRYRKVYQEVYRNSLRGISLPYVAETPEKLEELRRSMAPSLFAANYELLHIEVHVPLK